MNANHEKGRSAARYERVGWTAAAVLAGLAFGSMAGFRLTASSQPPVDPAVAMAQGPISSSFEEARSRLAERHIDFPTIASSAANASEEPGTSIAAYGN